MSFVATLSSPIDICSPWARVIASPLVLSNVPILSRVLNWNDLSSEISSLFPMLKSVAMAVAVSLSLVDPKVTSELLGGRETLVEVPEEICVVVCPDLSIVCSGRAVVSRVCLRNTLSSYFFWFAHHCIGVSESAVSLMMWLSGFSAP